MEIVAGRPEPVQPYTKLGDWVLFSGASGMACKLYWIFRGHVNHQRGDRLVWPTRRELAKMLGLAKTAGVDPYIEELKALGAIDVQKQHRHNGSQTNNLYTVHMAPPEGYTGPQSLTDVYKILRSGGVLPRTVTRARSAKPTPATPAEAKAASKKQAKIPKR